MIPEQGLGVIVLINNESAASYTVTDQIIDGYIGIKNEDRSLATFARFHAGQLSASRTRDSIFKKVVKQTRALHPVMKNYIGLYKDPWFGKITISIRNGRLYFAAERSPQLRGYLLAYKKDTFLVRWQNPELDADTFVIFEKDKALQMQQVTLRVVGSGSGGSYKDAFSAGQKKHRLRKIACYFTM